MGRSFSINRIFWCLLTGSFLFALVSSSVATWFASKPFLLETRYQAALSLAESEASWIQQALEPVTILTVFLASEPSLVGYVIGNSENADELSKRLDGLTMPDGLRGFKFLDFSAESLSSYDVGDVTIDPVEITVVKDLAQRVFSELDAQHFLIPKIGPPQSGLERILVAAPIFHQGFAEGVIVAIVDLNTGEIPNLHIEHAIQFRLVNSGDAPLDSLTGNPNVIVPVGDTGLQILLEDDAEVFQSIGQRMLAQTMLAVSVSLFLPFLLFGWLGKKTILAPHAEIEASRNKMRAQQKELSELAAIAQKSEEAIVVTDLDAQIIWVNPAFERMSGFNSKEIIGRRPSEFLYREKTDIQTLGRIRAAILTREAITEELINYAKDGSEFWVRQSISPLLNEHDESYGFMAILSDISANKEQEKNLRHANAEIKRQAMHDELTGLANRRYFNDILEERCHSNSPCDFCVIRIDLDHFKNVNDTMGHDAGDFVLGEVARILNEEVLEEDLPVRVGGDEFIVLMGRNTSVRETLNVASALRKQIAKPLNYEGKTLRLSASFGVAGTERNLVGLDDLVRAADSALYIAKERGRDCVVEYTQEIHDNVIAVRDMAEMIRRGLERSEFVPFYQPQVDAVTRAVVGVEVLARWKHPQRGIIQPAEFIGIADQLSILTILDKMVMDKALSDVFELEKNGIVLPKISFNVTANRLNDPILSKLVADQNFTHTKISFEILESVFLDDQPEILDFTLDLLRERGVLIEIDDFGSGHASMISLMRVNPDVLKIDQRLVFGATNSKIHRNMVRSIVGIARSLGISITAEGVETLEHADLMQELGCCTLQGYHFAQPMSFESLSTYLDLNSGEPILADRS